jgi:hypothetical protein
MGPVLWQRTDLSVDSPAPLLPLLPHEARVPPTPPQLETFAADLAWGVEPFTLRIGDLATVRFRSPHPADVAWILSVNMDARLRAAGTAMLGRLPPADRARVRDVRRLANFPALAPTGRRPLRPMVGPPAQYRLFAPHWFMEPHLRALQAEARRGRRG